MRLSDGAHLGSYEILSALGAGGMGEVYRARDTKLDRDVAIKVLPAAFVSHPARVARFQREAKTLAALNHPNIGGIYGLDESEGIAALVLELVHGPTLADRIAQGPIPLADALPIAKQITDALEAAHEHGIIHRDLKPPNIKLRPDGTVKVLDFGLAKLEGEGAGQARQAGRTGHDISQSSTLSAGTSLEGMILGTAPYMSPEQARGHAVDKRTDIWAFGCVLYEMLTGRAAFRGATLTDTLAAILERDPDWPALPVSTPQNIRRLLERCLQKDPRHRLRDIGDARIELADPQALIAPTVVVPPRALVRASRWAPWLLVAVAVGGLAYQRFVSPASRPLRPQASSESVGRFVEGLPEGTHLAPTPALAVSPDGRRLAYVVIQNGMRTLYVRDLDQVSAHPLIGTEGADQPFFSHDGRWIGFFAQSKLKKVSVVGRASVVLADAPSARGGSWGPDDSIIFAPSSTSVLLRLSATGGGTPQPVTALDRTLNEGSHRWPHLLSSGDAVLFAAGPTVTARGWNEAHLIVQSLKTGARRLVAPHGTYPVFAATSHLLFLQDGVVYRQQFNSAQLDVTGEAVPVLERVGSSWRSNSINGGSYDFAVSASGTLAYLPDVARAPDSMVWVDRRGAEEPLAFPVQARGYTVPRLSPDGRHLAVTVIGVTDSEVWVHDFSRETPRRLTYGGRNLWPLWTPDGTHIAYASSREGSTNVYSKPSDGSGAEEQLTASPYMLQPHSWSPDRTTLAMIEAGPQNRSHIMLLPLNGQPTPWPSSESQGAVSKPKFSPDGRWIAYLSNESGQNEVYVRAYPGPGATIPVSTAGGDEPVWARSGRDLFFRRGPALMAVDIVAGRNTLSVGMPKQLFSGSYIVGTVFANYDVSTDAQKFLFIKSSEAALNRSRFSVALNWLDELAAVTSPRQ